MAATASTATPPTRSAFFYGTLMAPSVLHRVTNTTMTPRDPSKPAFHIRPAILPGFRRHRVKYADYPAIVPISRTAKDPSDAAAGTTSQTQSHMSSEVRGTYVTGLVSSDIRRLDAFEGSEYERQFVRVKLLPENAAVPEQAVKGGSTAPTVAGSDAAAGEEGGEWVQAETYVWISNPDELEDREWDFDEFVRERLWVWAGGKGDSGFEEAAKVELESNGASGQKSPDPTGGRSVHTGEFEKMMAERENGLP